MRKCILILPILILLPACSSPSTPPGPPPVDVSQGVSELGELYRYLHAQKLPPPTRAEDLQEYEGTLAAALPLVREGKIVVVWKVGYAPSSSEVIAYEKDAAINGGKVLLRNGTVKAMTAAEFASAPKAR